MRDLPPVLVLVADLPIRVLSTSGKDDLVLTWAQGASPHEAAMYGLPLAADHFEALRPANPRIIQGP